MVSRAFHNNPIRTNYERIQTFKELWKKNRGEDLIDAQALNTRTPIVYRYELALAHLLFKVFGCGAFLWLFHWFPVLQPHIVYIPHKIHRDTKT